MYDTRRCAAEQLTPCWWGRQGEKTTQVTANKHSKGGLHGSGMRPHYVDVYRNPENWIFLLEHDDHHQRAVGVPCAGSSSPPSVSLTFIIQRHKNTRSSAWRLRELIRVWTSRTPDKTSTLKQTKATSGCRVWVSVTYRSASPSCWWRWQTAVPCRWAWRHSRWLTARCWLCPGRRTHTSHWPPSQPRSPRYLDSQCQPEQEGRFSTTWEVS